MKILRLLVCLAITIGLYFALDTKIGIVPPLGKFLNPFGGFWQNAESRIPPADIDISLADLQGEVEIVFDERMIPHIFAENEHDLYYAQGYVTAKFRLWQMEFQTHAAAGRLSEILGAGDGGIYLQNDLFQRRMGILYAAEKALEVMQADEKMKKVLDAYSEGVNAYITQLKPKDLPLEYKLLDYAPEKWTPLKSALLLKYMAFDLSAENSDLEMTNMLENNGKKVMDELFPNYPRRHDPIIPGETKWSFKALQNPKTPKQITSSFNPDDKKKKSQEKDKGIGSNNWAISGDKTASGLPILANDPHLALNLPSIWFEIQLVSPDVNVYGAALPGSPCVTIGFNKEVAWGVTNVAPDVLDWYKIKFKDGTMKEYWHDEQWKPTTQRIEEIKIKGGGIKIDTVVFTHHGPIVSKNENESFVMARSTVPPGHALRWIAHDASNELQTFYLLNKAKDYKDYRKAISMYSCPAQNFVFADVNNDIAITSQGKYPLKWKEQGKYILDGTNPKHDWQGWIPFEHNPTIKNPARGFVSSANQFPTDTLYPYYLNWEFATFERGKRINELLAGMQKATYKTFLALQNDNLEMNARDVLPKMLSYISIDTLKNSEKEAYKGLQKWDFNDEINMIAPSIFNLWWRNMLDAVWADDFDKDTEKFPEGDLTGDLILINDSLPSRWFNNVNSNQTENLKELIGNTFRATIDTLEKKYGEYGENWSWGKYKTTSINHLANIPGFSVRNLSTNGNSRVVNATGRRSGPSWRMIVQLGKSPEAYAIYPGGQSGNPGSFYYSNFIEMWQKGELAKLIYMQKASESDVKVISRMTLSKKS